MLITKEKNKQRSYGSVSPIRNGPPGYTGWRNWFLWNQLLGSFKVIKNWTLSPEMWLSTQLTNGSVSSWIRAMTLRHLRLNFILVSTSFSVREMAQLASNLWLVTRLSLNRPGEHCGRCTACSKNLSFFIMRLYFKWQLTKIHKDGSGEPVMT